MRPPPPATRQMRTQQRWSYEEETWERIRANLAVHPRCAEAPEGLKPAAVSVGARITETALDAARRELHEELGIEAGPAQVLGRLDNLPTTSGYLVAPFVIRLGAHSEPTPSPHEIAAVHRIPLADLFAGPGRGVNRGVAGADDDGRGAFSRYIPTLGHDLFAPTAAILFHFCEVALRGRPTPPPRYRELPFARR